LKRNTVPGAPGALPWRPGLATVDNKARIRFETGIRNLIGLSGMIEAARHQQQR